jgi:hypothetical protein
VVTVHRSDHGESITTPSCSPSHLECFVQPAIVVNIALNGRSREQRRRALETMQLTSRSGLPGRAGRRRYACGRACGDGYRTGGRDAGRGAAQNADTGDEEMPRRREWPLRARAQAAVEGPLTRLQQRREILRQERQVQLATLLTAYQGVLERRRAAVQPALESVTSSIGGLAAEPYDTRGNYGGRRRADEDEDRDDGDRDQDEDRGARARIQNRDQDRGQGQEGQDQDGAG